MAWACINYLLSNEFIFHIQYTSTSRNRQLSFKVVVFKVLRLPLLIFFFFFKLLIHEFDSSHGF